MVTLTKSTKPQREGEIERAWHLIDLKGKILGRAAGSIAQLIQGKHKSAYSPNLDAGDYVVVINAKQVVLTGRKLLQKTYTRYSGYPGGLKVRTAQDLLAKTPTKVIHYAVSGMLPKNKLRKTRLTRLFIFTDERHPYQEKFTSKDPSMKTSKTIKTKN